MSFTPNPWIDKSLPPSQSPGIVQAPKNYPATLRDEKRCLQEIRGKGAGISVNAILSTGIRAMDFALFYVSKYHLIRKNKDCRRGFDGQYTNQSPQNPNKAIERVPLPLLQAET